ncbi:anaerobic sulfatase maturase [Abyssisolibacter fermentans]|uniref:anaerobic sulfatase maturase n=1 Tax=Abyssisolibacter fermentans TaxID=1766203 RepID=UPI00082D5541|nr:anaerobic sulfatase maturase [Abyssisolibacter fermentans]
MPPLNLLIKPASSNCNLKCKYCFYNSIAENREIASYGIMKEDILEIIVKKALEYADGACNFAFQGGEPTLAGLDFYKHLIKLQNQYNNKNIKITNTIQTNGTMIDKQWAEFLSKNNFLVGISLDGPRDINDLNRIDREGIGSFKKVIEAINLLKEYKVDYNILFVVTANSSRHVNKIYNFFKKNNMRYLQFIPCLDPLFKQTGTEEYSLTPEKYLKFLKEFFDLWYSDAVKDDFKSVRYFDNILGILLGHETEACDMRGMCTVQNVIEADGSVYSCDFYVTDDYCLGSISDNNFEDFINTNTAKSFIEASFSISSECKECKWFKLCRGGCRRYRSITGYDSLPLNYYCQTFKQFFEYSYDRFYEIARMITFRNNSKY